jgi:hypothetical protein
VRYSTILACRQNRGRTVTDPTPAPRPQPNSPNRRALVTEFINYILELHDLVPEECGDITVSPGFESRVTVQLRKPNGKKFVLITDEDEALARSLGATDDDIRWGEVATRVSKKPVLWNRDEIKGFKG